MTLALRLARNHFHSHFLKNGSGAGAFLNFSRPVIFKPTQASNSTCGPAAAGQNESHDEKNVRLGRPQSPHLTIYKPQLTAILSISQRTTGIILSGYAILLSLAAVYLPCPMEFYIESLECYELGTPIIAFGKFCLAFPLTYHYFNGIRHTFWDLGKFLTIKEVYMTGYLMLLCAWAAAAGLSVI